VAFAPDSKRIATASEDRTVVITPLNDPARRVVLRHDEPVADVRFSPDGRYVLTGIRKLAYVWDAESGRLLHELRGHKPYLPDGEEVFGEFSPLGTIVTRSSDDGTGRVWDVGTGRQLAVLRGHQERSLFHASFSPDGHTIITTGQDHTARLWDPESGRMRAVLRGHDGAVVDAAFSPDGRLIATTGYDGTIRIWNSKGQSVTILHAGSRVWRVAFDPQSRRVAAACDDGTVRVYVVGYDELLEMARTRLPLLVTSDARSRRRDSIDPSVWSGKTW
jgi:YD repeat-containing protein